VLIVEDDPIIAIDFEDTFWGEGGAQRRKRGSGA
jgi:hypothetical protein